MLRIFGPKMEEVTGGLRNLYNEELHNFNFAKDLCGQMNENEKCDACTVHSTQVTEEDFVYSFGRKVKEGDDLEDLDLGGLNLKG
jgi:hypothetical protein